MPFFGNLIGGFSSALQKNREEEAERGRQQQDMELKIFTELAQSPDPEIQAAAITGLLGVASPKKPGKGLKGFLGEVGQNPALEQIRQLVGTPVTTSREVTKTAPPTYSPVPPTTAAMVGGSSVEPGGTGPLPVQPNPAAGGGAAGAAPVVGGPPSLAEAVPQVSQESLSGALPGGLQPTFPTSTSTVTTSRPRQVFPQQGAEVMAGLERDVAGLGRILAQWGYGPEETQRIQQQWVQTELQRRMAPVMNAETARMRAEQPRGAGGAGGGGVARPIEGTLNGQAAFGVFNPQTQKFHSPDTGEALEGFQPKSRVSGGGAGAQDLGDAVEKVAVEQFGMTTAQLRAAGRTADAQEAIRLARERGLSDPAYLAGQRTYATETTRQGTDRYKPLPAQQTQEMGLPAGVAPVDMEGVTLNTDQQVAILAAATQLRPALEQAEAGVLKVFPNAGTLRTNLTLRELELSADPDYRVLGQQLALIVRNANSVLANDPDRLTDADADRVQKALVSLDAGTFFSDDTRASALAKIRNLREQVARVHARLRAPVAEVERRFRQRQATGVAAPPPPPGPPPDPRGPGRPSTFTSPAQALPSPSGLYRMKDGRFVRKLEDGSFRARNPQTGQFDIPVTVQ